MLQNLIERFLPDRGLAQQLALPIILVAVLAAVIAGYLRSKGVKTPYTRKIFHFIIFSLAGLLQFYFGLKAVTLLGGFVFMLVVAAVLAGERWWFYRALARETDAPHEKKFIVLPLIATAVGGVVSNIFFPATAFIGYFVGGWGDAVGEPVGTRWGRHRYTVPTLFGVKATRSLEGSAAVMLVSALIASLCLLSISSLTLLVCLFYGLLCGLAGALVEAISSHGLDNFTMQVAAAGILQLLLGLN